MTHCSPLGYWLNVHHSAVYLPHQTLPFGTAEQWHYQHLPKVQIAHYQQHPVYLLLNTDETLDYQPLRSYLHVDEELTFTLHRAVGLKHFFQQHQFCGRCTTQLHIEETPLAVRCTQCQSLTFPRISPSIIVGIRHQHHILLAHHLRHKQPVYTVLAGFVEVGETIEQAVHREVFEECGIKVKNLHYIGSQAWSFPDALMIGFVADYEAGEIQIQADEIRHATWFDARQPLPVSIPNKGTIAHEIIQYLIQQIQQSST